MPVQKHGSGAGGSVGGVLPQRSGYAYAHRVFAWYGTVVLDVWTVGGKAIYLFVSLFVLSVQQQHLRRCEGRWGGGMYVPHGGSRLHGRKAGRQAGGRKMDSARASLEGVTYM
jgi:hypothetical protein